MMRPYTLLRESSPEWVDAALGDFDALLLDHASCERKASAVGMSFVVRYPDRTAILDPMIRFAREELEHFHQVYKVIAERGLMLGADEPDPYVSGLMQPVRHGRDERFLDRLLVSGIIEARGTERLGLLAEVLTDARLKGLYGRLARAEAQHSMFFVDMARIYFAAGEISHRLQELLGIEADLIERLPIRAAIH